MKTMTEFIPAELTHNGHQLDADAAWVRDEPYVAALIADLTAAIAAEADRRLALTLEHLRDVAINNEGVLDAYHGEPSLKSICAKGALVWTNVRAGGRIRTELNRWLPRFRVGSDHTVTKNSGTARAPSKMEIVRRYVRRCQKTGELVPSDGCGRVSVEGAAYAMGQHYEWLRGNVQCMRIIRKAIDAGTIKLGPAWQHPNPMSQEELEERLDLICRFICGCDVTGGALPRKATHRDQIDYEYIRDAVGLTGSTHERHPRVAAVIAEVKAKRGMRVPGEQLPDTWACLLAEGLRHITDLKAHTTSVDVTVSAHQGVLERIMRLHDQEAGIDDLVGDAFGKTFDNLVDKLMQGRAPGDAGNVRRAAHLWRDIHDDERARNGLPASFGQALSILINRSAKTMVAVAEEAHTTVYLLRNWIAERLVVGVDKRDTVKRVALALDADPEILLSRATTGSLNRADTTCSEDYLALPHRDRKYLPRDKRGLKGAELEEAVEKIKPLLGGGTSFGRIVQLSRNPDLRLPPVNKTARLEAELGELLAYKTGGSAWPLRRVPGAVWNTDATIEMNMGAIDGFLRFCGAPAELGGAAVPHDDLTIGLLATVLAPAFRVFCARRYEDMDWDGAKRGMRFTSGDIDFLRLVRSLTNEQFGFLTQLPKFGERIPLIDRRLPPRLAEKIKDTIPGAAVRPIVTSFDLERYHRMWTACCADTHAHVGDSWRSWTSSGDPAAIRSKRSWG
ncbi:hypothetical protein EAH87_14130 [Sphingomonas koreensis]|nr:hypothetical protein EAH87_14130 [Sphingomonas koreensis]